MKPDSFDILGLAAAAALCAAAVVVVVTSVPDEAAVFKRVSSRSLPAAPAADPGPKLGAARRLIDAGQAKEAVGVLAELAKSNLADPAIHAMLGEAGARLQDYPQSMMEYRLTLQMDPEYVDKKSAKFIGSRIKVAVKEAMSCSKAILRDKPDDGVAKSTLKDAYYLERMLAGGCE